MAILHGSQSRYLIWNRSFRRITTLIYALLFFSSYGYILLLWIQNLRNYPKLIAILVIFGPILYLIKKLTDKELYYFLCFKNGYQGESSIILKLQELPDTYHIYSDCKLPGKNENVDYIVLGPTGLFTIEAKSQKGKVELNGNTVTINSKPFPSNPISQVERQYWGLHEYLKTKSIDIFIDPILVFSNDYAQVRFGIKKIKNIFIVQRRWLDRVVIQNQRQIQLERINQVTPLLDKLILSPSELTKSTI